MSDQRPIESSHQQHCGNTVSRQRASIQRALTGCLLVLFCLIGTGCTSVNYLTRTSVRNQRLAKAFRFRKRSEPQLSERTLNVLARYGLKERYEHDQIRCVSHLRSVVADYPDPELVYGLVELSFVQGERAELEGRFSDALNQFGIALTNSYDYLFSENLSGVRNRYDPQFRAVCDLYNDSLEHALRLLCAQNKLAPGGTYNIKTRDREFVIHTKMRGTWKPEEFDRYEFASDFEIETLRNKHTTYGLGVPLIAVRKPVRSAKEEKYYPEGLSYAVTALMRCGKANPGADGETNQCVLEFIDPLVANQIQLSDHWVPLETDLTTPLAYSLNNPAFKERTAETIGLLNPADAQQNRGLFMLEPYDPNRIPVLMVHGLWSSPRTWMDMFNDLRSFPEIRERYQFWFYLYPSGQPFWNSADEMRSDLAEMRDVFDPGHNDKAADQMVLVGHSMGGLVSRMQTIDSGDDFWKIVSDEPASKMNGPTAERNRLVSTLFFKPNQSIRRVITIGTPHRGSHFANNYTRWLARKVIKLPTMAITAGNRLAKANPRLFKDTELLTVANAIDSLAPESPIFPVMRRAKYSPGVKFHNIIGVLEDPSFVQRRIGKGDGFVTLASARIEGVESELLVDAEHTSVHMTGKSIYEVRRILLEHMQEIDVQDRIAALDTLQVETASATSVNGSFDSSPFDDGDSEESSSRLVPVTIMR